MISLKASKKPFQGESKFIGEGQHVVTIKSMVENLAKASPNWKDRTPQIDVEFEDANGKTIKMWLNLKGYHSKSDEKDGFVLPKNAAYRSSEGNREEYAVDKKTGLRIESQAKTEQCETILADFLYNTGIEEVEDLCAELVGAQIGINVVKKESTNFNQVQYTMEVSRVEEAGE